MSSNRGMSVEQAKALAKDANTSIAVLTRLANGYPETWPEISANPNVTKELTSWIGNAQKAQQSALPASKATADTKLRTRGRRTMPKFVRMVSLLIVPALAIAGLVYGVQYLHKHKPVVGVVVEEALTQVTATPAWKYDLSAGSNYKCVQYQFGTVAQNRVAVLTQNDLEKKDCKDRTDIPSTLALVDLTTGVAVWKIDLAAELDWTEKWKKQLVEVPGLREILIKYIDVNGSDAGDNVKSIDSGDDRKMKTIVPYNPLNGRIPDPVLAKSKSQPIMQAPVLEVLAIPGNLKSVIVMTNGAKKDFRYAKYRSKRFSSARWSVESDLRPIGGTQIVNNKLILGREKGDQPVAVNLASGNLVDWAGKPAVKLYHIGAAVIQVSGDGVSDKATNAESQGGPKGHSITIDSIDGNGRTLWSIKSNGFAIARDDSVTTSRTRSWFNQLFILDGKNNSYVSRVDPANGKSMWRTQISQEHFELARTTAGGQLGVYLYKKYNLDTKTMSFLNLNTGNESDPIDISGKSVRVDGATLLNTVLVDEPDRQKIVKDAEAGKVASLTREDKSDQSRKCAQGVSNQTSKVAWIFECTGNEHVIRTAGRWLVLDLTPGKENFWTLKAGA